MAHCVGQFSGMVVSLVWVVDQYMGTIKHIPHTQVVFHLLPAFQVHAQSFFANKYLIKQRSRLKGHLFDLSGWKGRLVRRSIYVMVLTGPGAAFPFFCVVCSLCGGVQCIVVLVTHIQ